MSSRAVSRCRQNLQGGVGSGGESLSTEALQKDSEDGAARLELCLPRAIFPHSVVIRLVGGFTVTNQSFSGAVKPPTSDLWADCCGCHGFFGGQSASSDESQRRWHQASPAVWGP